MTNQPQNRKLDQLIAGLRMELPQSCEDSVESDARNVAALVCHEMRDGLYPIPSRVIQVVGIDPRTPGAQGYAAALLKAVSAYLLISLDVAAQDRQAYVLNKAAK